MHRLDRDGARCWRVRPYWALKMPNKVDIRHKEIGGKHRALSRYYMIANRLKNTDKSKNAKYVGIKLLVSKEDFVSWFSGKDFDGCSVDRKDSSRHYELSNMRLIPLANNIAKEKLKAMAGFSVCFRCKLRKPLDEFVNDKRRLCTGKTTICRPCETARKKDPK